jgi:hypothetical protein
MFNIAAMVAIASDVVPVAAAYAARKRLPQDLLILAVLLCLYLGMDLVAATMALNGIRNLWLGNLEACADFPVLVWIFHQWEPQPRNKAILRGLIVASIPLWALTQWQVGGIQRYNFAGRSIQSIVLSALAIAFLHRFAVYGDERPWTNPRFLVALAVLLQFAGSIFAFSFGFLMETKQMVAIWRLRNVMSTLSNLVFAGGFWCLRQSGATGG